MGTLNLFLLLSVIHKFFCVWNTPSESSTSYFGINPKSCDAEYRKLSLETAATILNVLQFTNNLLWNIPSEITGYCYI